MIFLTLVFGLNKCKSYLETYNNATFADRCYAGIIKMVPSSVVFIFAISSICIQLKKKFVKFHSNLNITHWKTLKIFKLTMSSSHNSVMVGYSNQIVNGFSVIFVNNIWSHVQIRCREFDLSVKFISPIAIIAESFQTDD